MFIQTETTPYPARLKFLPGCPVMEKGTADFTDANDARRSPFATADADPPDSFVADQSAA